ncbi:hypothetical protein AUEXF2481DRAFT_42946 [Aureobasidium subglaciale EXF-2481]|uniref:Aconitase X catalytic domain-containing protein n=1 Tax=Aureobasidium subglaciale (strain EXF-2481) TaxID=1043005 RepID=A0A074Z067_AURSE|nr:uncharacterized protein AUEXF2481DRAFT_42946 [Aureobasidium subglaciale EXF-2481]KAI5210836.1 hypothetical protein E4T38_01782 [Aureobasidium subglaciale]KAI5229264.1 hypothetical protein E4T40_01698 [Aureobasidium subglaciale]KAI5232847.1 hypothetical protein E4T41_01780 [Aureobasidium subglaciale]KAI5266275.1 hypothetical protein E4T46_01695 [Aureobasidium subglaciale]KEQ92496.1 hypothetical protein AUEXF2481DRAFT_42946 [Aureobasidium subglaciale EXF-2481]
MLTSTPKTIQGRCLSEGYGAGPLLYSNIPLSFWGGVDPATGIVIDQHHPLAGSSLAGKILAIPSGRGSCSGSGVLLELLLNGNAPAGFIFEREELILTLGTIIAAEFFEKSVPIAQVSPERFSSLAGHGIVQIANGIVEVNPESISNDSSDYEKPPVAGINLTELDQAMLGGEYGKAVQVAARVVSRVAAIQGATELIDITQAHIDGCIYTGPATLLFAQRLCDWGARVRIPATLNSISVDRQRWRDQGVDAALGEPSGLLADAYVKLGATPTYTCAPYLLDTAPKEGEQIMWAESNAVIFANSVLGARSIKCPDFLDICVALTGRAPNSGAHITEHRKPQVMIDVASDIQGDDSFFPVLGYLVGELAANRIPLVVGLEDTKASRDNLKAFGAAFATTSSAPMFHIAGITPEAISPALEEWKVSTLIVKVDRTDLVDIWSRLDKAVATKVELVSLGNPHFSYDEMVLLSKLCEGRTKHASVAMIVTCGRDTYAKACKAGIMPKLEEFGVQPVTDTCWCMIGEPLIHPSVKTIMTNSAKFAHYGGGLTGRAMRFGSLAACVEAACMGESSRSLPSWLGWNDFQ